MLKRDIDAVAMLHRAITSWYVILLVGLVGAIIGWLISFARPPLYQASVFIEYAVDYSRTAHMDDITVHQAYEQVRRMLLADETLQATLDAAQKRVGGELIFADTADLRSQIQLSRYPGGFELIVYGQDPEQSAAAVNELIAGIVTQLRTAMFAAGAADVPTLQRTPVTLPTP